MRMSVPGASRPPRSRHPAPDRAKAGWLPPWRAVGLAYAIGLRCETARKSATGGFGCPPADRVAACSGCGLRARVSPDRLRRLPEGAQEGAAHAVAIGKTRLP